MNVSGDTRLCGQRLVLVITVWAAAVVIVVAMVCAAVMVWVVWDLEASDG